VGDVLGSFSGEELSRITNAATRLGPIAPGQLMADIDRFLAAFAEGPGINGGIEQSQNLVRAAAIVDAGSGPEPDVLQTQDEPTIWQKCSHVPADVFLQWLSEEPIYIRATLISLLPSTYASDLLGRMAPNEAGEIIALLPNLSGCSSGIYAAIEEFINEKISDFAQSGERSSERVVDLVSRISPSEFKQISASLLEINPALAHELQESMFEFEAFPTLDIDGRRLVVERMSPDVISQSLLGADSDLVEAFCR